MLTKAVIVPLFPAVVIGIVLQEAKTCYLDRLLEKNNIVRIFCNSTYLFVSVVGSLFPNTQLYICTKVLPFGGMNE